MPTLTVVQSVGNCIDTGNGSGPKTVSATLTVTVGNTLVIAVGASPAQIAGQFMQAPVSVTDSLGHTYTAACWQDGHYPFTGNAGGIYFAPITHAGSCTVTFSVTSSFGAFGGTVSLGLAVAECTSMVSTSVQATGTNPNPASGSASFTLADSAGASVSTTFPSSIFYMGNMCAVADLHPTGADFWVGCQPGWYGETPAAPTGTITYQLIRTATSPSGFPVTLSLQGTPMTLVLPPRQPQTFVS